VIGRPILYRTSKEFLMRFGLSDLQELPSLKEFEALAREALGTDEGIATPGAGDESVLDGMVEGAAVGEAHSEKVQAEEVMSTEETQAAQEQMPEPVAETPAVEAPVSGEARQETAAESSETTIEPAPETAAGEGDEEKSRKAVAGEKRVVDKPFSSSKREALKRRPTAGLTTARKIRDQDHENARTPTK